MIETTIGIIEDSHHYRQKIIDYLKNVPGYSISFAISAFSEYDKTEHKTSILLFDLASSKEDGLKILKKIKEESPETAVIVLINSKEVNTIYASLRGGASAYVSKASSLQKIRESIDIVKNGGSFMSPSIAKKVIHFFDESKRKSPILTKRQFEIVKGIVDGKSYKKIAEHLDISVDTVRDHIRKIYKTLNVNSKFEVISKYYKKEI